MPRVPIDEKNMARLKAVGERRGMSVVVLANTLIDFSLSFPQQGIQDVYNEMVFRDDMHVVQCAHCKKRFSPAVFSEHAGRIADTLHNEVFGVKIPLWRKIKESKVAGSVMIDERNSAALTRIASRWKMPLSILVNMLIDFSFTFSQWEGVIII